MQIPFSVCGTAIAPAVQLSTGCLSFGSLAASETLAKAVYIHNKADLPIYFEFVTDQQGVFAFDRVRGSVAAQSVGCVTVTFQPKEASNFWRRITFLIRVSKLQCPLQSYSTRPSVAYATISRGKEVQLTILASVIVSSSSHTAQTQLKHNSSLTPQYKCDLSLTPHHKQHLSLIPQHNRDLSLTS